jgi:hypothetical protein
MYRFQSPGSGSTQFSKFSFRRSCPGLQQHSSFKNGNAEQWIVNVVENPFLHVSALVQVFILVSTAFIQQLPKPNLDVMYADKQKQHFSRMNQSNSKRDDDRYPASDPQQASINCWNRLTSCEFNRTFAMQLCEAAKNGDVSKLNHLLHAGARIDARFEGQSALHCAVRAGQVPAVRILLSKGADLEALEVRHRWCLRCCPAHISRPPCSEWQDPAALEP